jgi:RHS repeat-associated protein
VSYGYAGDGRLSSVSGYVSAIAYNSAGQITSITYANGTTATYTYNPDRNALTTSQLNGPAGVLYQASYAYDAAERVLSTSSTTNPLMNCSYTYDPLNRLTAVSGAQAQTFAYDALGNMTSNSAVGAYAYASPKKHAVTTAGSATYTYDAVGNMTSGAGRSMVWDYDNRLASVTSAGTTTSFAYDHQGLRVWKTSPAGDVRTFDNRVELEGTNLVKYYYAGPMLVAKRTPTAAFWYHADHLGSTKVLTNAAGAQARSYDYAPFGATIASTGSVANDREFGGHKAESAGLIFMTGRYYDPGLGRFISADSMVPDGGNPQALNRYTFVYNNPIMNTDPTGHAPIVAAVIGAIIANTTVAWVAAAIVAVGYVTKSPLLMTIGSIVAGYPNVFGMAVAAISSPLSPLNPKLKQVIGWAYTAYNLFQWTTSNSRVGATSDPMDAMAQAPAEATAKTQAKFQAMQDALEQSEGLLLKETRYNIAFGTNDFTAKIAATFGWTHVTTTFTDLQTGEQITFNVQTDTGNGGGLWSQFKDLVTTMTGKQPVFNYDGLYPNVNYVFKESALVTASEFAGFGNAYLTNMQLNALPGGMYNPGQSNNAANAGNAAQGSALKPTGPTCLFCQ